MNEPAAGPVRGPVVDVRVVWVPVGERSMPVDVRGRFARRIMAAATTPAGSPPESARRRGTSALAGYSSCFTKAMVVPCAGSSGVLT